VPAAALTRSSTVAVMVVALAFAVLAGPARAEHANGHRAPTEPAPVLFAEDFTPPLDGEYDPWPLGGFGGIRRGSPITHLPIIFVHGNQADAQNWYAVRDQFMATAGYTEQELWALSYGGLGYVGGSTPVRHDGGESAYVQQHPQAAISGNPQNNDVNVPDLLAFIDAVREYTGAEQVQIVSHSLGVTIVRKAMLVRPALREQVAGVVAIAGANHGTSVCAGLDDDYYGCDEIAPGTAWLAQINDVGEAPGPTRWMTVYDGTGAGDIFYQPQDAQSPALDGAEHNNTYPNTSHNDLRIAPEIVEDYLAFLLEVEADLRSAADRAPSPDTAPAPVDGQPKGLPATGAGWGSLAIALPLMAARRRFTRARQEPR
jgi:triacylglycerol lipase